MSAVFAEAFEEVKPQQSIMRIIDPEKIEMIVYVAKRGWMNQRGERGFSSRRAPCRARTSRKEQIGSKRVLTGRGVVSRS